MSSTKTHSRSALAAEGRPEDGGGKDDASTNYLAQVAASWQAMSSVWTAWIEAAHSLSRERGIDAGKSLARIFDPQFWKAGELRPLLEELSEAFSLPQLADLPRLEPSALDSSAAMLDLVGLINQYMMVSVPMWLSASQHFQAEITERAKRGEALQSPGDALDLWNAVLDRTLMEFNRSGDFARVQQRLLRASAQYRLQLRKIGEHGARLFDTPTRAEMTDVYRRVHDMQREIQSLRREVGNLRADRKVQAKGATLRSPNA